MATEHVILVITPVKPFDKGRAVLYYPQCSNGIVARNDMTGDTWIVSKSTLVQPNS